MRADPATDLGEGPARTGTARDLALLLALPLAVALLGSDWLWGTPTRDSWIYFGYFKRLPVYLSTFLTSYFSSRLSVLIPGWLFHSVFPPIVAHVVLHLLLVQAALAAFYLTTRSLFGRRPALFASAVLAVHPFFLIALGDNYVDGFGIAFVFIALVATTRAARAASPSLLAISGAFAVLLVSANLFYAVFLPFLVVHYIVLRGRAEPRDLLLGVAAATSGAVGAFAGLCVLSKALGGRYFYILASLQFADSLVRQANPFRWPLGSWLPVAVWLVFPLVTLAGVPVALRRWRGAATPILLWSQFAAVGFFLVMLAVEALPVAPVLQWWFYASLLIPFTFLAFAGQVGLLFDRVDEVTFRWILGSSLLVFLLAHAVRLPHARLLALVPAPVLLPLVAALGVPVALHLSARRRVAAAVVLVVSLAASGLLARNLTWFDRDWDRLGGGRRALFRQVVEAEGIARRYDPGTNLYYWWDQDDDLHPLFDLVGATALSGARILNLAFPDTESSRTATGAPVVPGMKVAILSRREDAAALGRASLERAGFSTVALGEEDVPGPGTSFRMTFLELRPGQGSGTQTP